LKIILWVFLITFFPTGVFATADGPDHFSVTKVKNWDVLNIRAKPHYKANKIGSIPYNGNCVQNLGCEGGLTLKEYSTLTEAQKKAILKKRPRWCKVNYQGTIGWVNARYLGEGTCP